MRTFRKIALLGTIIAGLVLMYRIVDAMVVKYNAYLANEAGLTFNKNYVLPLNSYNIDYLSFIAVASSVTFTNQNFIDGQLSTGSIKVASITGLTASSATDSITIETTTFPSGAILTVNQTNIVLSNYADITTTAAAINLTNAINALVPDVLATTGGSVVYTTATIAGLYGNNMTLSLNVSTQTLLFASYTSSTATSGVSNFTGGKDPAFVSVNGKSYVAGKDFVVTNFTSSTATNLATAITASSNTFFVIAAATGTGGNLVLTTSTFVGANTNYVMASSTDALLTIGGSTKTVTGLGGASIGQMWGGLDSAYTLVLGSATAITLSTNAYTLGLPVLYTNGGTDISGLTNKTTYYVIPITNNSIGLAKTSTDAVAGNFIALTSSMTKPTYDNFTLAPLAIGGVPSYMWQVSNDGINWNNYMTNDQGVAISSVTLGTYVATGTYTAWDFGEVDYAFIRLAVISPTSGAIKLQVAGNGKNSSQ